jgi:hypothetical protein
VIPLPSPSLNRPSNETMPEISDSVLPTYADACHHQRSTPRSSAPPAAHSSMCHSSTLHSDGRMSPTVSSITRSAISECWSDDDALSSCMPSDVSTLMSSSSQRHPPPNIQVTQNFYVSLPNVPALQEVPRIPNDLKQLLDDLHVIPVVRQEIARCLISGPGYGRERWRDVLLNCDLERHLDAVLAAMES